MKCANLFLAGLALMASATVAVAAPAVTAKMKAAVADTSRPAADTARDENRKLCRLLQRGRRCASLEHSDGERDFGSGGAKGPGGRQG